MGIIGACTFLGQARSCRLSAAFSNATSYYLARESRRQVLVICRVAVAFTDHFLRLGSYGKQYDRGQYHAIGVSANRGGGRATLVPAVESYKQHQRIAEAVPGRTGACRLLTDSSFPLSGP